VNPSKSHSDQLTFKKTSSKPKSSLNYLKNNTRSVNNLFDNYAKDISWNILWVLEDDTTKYFNNTLKKKISKEQINLYNKAASEIL
jgi:hypothetical protein